MVLCGALDLLPLPFSIYIHVSVLSALCTHSSTFYILQAATSTHSHRAQSSKLHSSAVLRMRAMAFAPCLNAMCSDSSSYQVRCFFFFICSFFLIFFGLKIYFFVVVSCYFAFRRCSIHVAGGCSFLYIIIIYHFDHSTMSVHARTLNPWQYTHKQEQHTNGWTRTCG